MPDAAHCPCSGFAEIQETEIVSFEVVITHRSRPVPVGAVQTTSPVPRSLPGCVGHSGADPALSRR